MYVYNVTMSSFHLSQCGPADAEQHRQWKDGKKKKFIIKEEICDINIIYNPHE